MALKNRIVSLITALALAASGLFAVPAMPAYAASNEDTAFNYLVGTKGLSKAAACGIMGAISVASDFKPKQTDNGYGLCAWNDARKAALKKYTSNYKTVKGQLKFMLHEMKSDFKSTYDYVTGVKNSKTGAYNAAYQTAYSYIGLSLSDSTKAASRAADTYWPGYKDKSVSSSKSSSTKSSSSSSSKKSSSKSYTTATYVVTGCSYLNYRTSPSKKNSKNIAGQFKKGQTVKCDTSYSKKVGSTTWYRFKKNGKWYYVSSKYLTLKEYGKSGSTGSFSSSSSSSSSSKTGKNSSKSSTSGTTTYYVTGCSALNYRTSPSKKSSSNIAGTLKKGKSVKCEKGYSKKAEGTTWYRFKKNGKKYYVSSKYLTKTKPKSSSSSSSSKSSSKSSGSYKSYKLSSSQIKGIAALCEKEQGTNQKGVAAEATLIANRYQLYGSKYSSLYSYVANCRWWGKSAGSYMSSHSPKKSASKSTVKDVICNGNRTMPSYVDEHDCISDISYATNNGKRINKSSRSKYKQGVTKIHNVYGATYTFWCFPCSGADPFGYTKKR